MNNAKCRAYPGKCFVPHEDDSYTLSQEEKDQLDRDMEISFQDESYTPTLDSVARTKFSMSQEIRSLIAQVPGWTRKHYAQALAALFAGNSYEAIKRISKLIDKIRSQGQIRTEEGGKLFLVMN